MNASILDLRYKTRKILKALENRESVVVLYHGKPKGMLIPMPGDNRVRVCNHMFFGMRSKEKRSVLSVMNTLRKARHAL